METQILTICPSPACGTPSKSSRAFGGLNQYQHAVLELEQSALRFIAAARITNIRNPLMSIGTLIKTIQDIMRSDVGVDGDAQRISQIVWLLFLKIFDDKEQEWQLTIPGYKSPLQTRFRWSNWAKDAEGITGEELIDFDQRTLPSLKTGHLCRCHAPRQGGGLGVRGCLQLHEVRHPAAAGHQHH